MLWGIWEVSEGGSQSSLFSQSPLHAADSLILLLYLPSTRADRTSHKNQKAYLLSLDFQTCSSSSSSFLTLFLNIRAAAAATTFTLASRSLLVSKSKRNFYDWEDRHESGLYRWEIVNSTLVYHPSLSSVRFSFPLSCFHNSFQLPCYLHFDKHSHSHIVLYFIAHLYIDICLLY